MIKKETERMLNLYRRIKQADEDVRDDYKGLKRAMDALDSAKSVYENAIMTYQRSMGYRHSLNERFKKEFGPWAYITFVVRGDDLDLEGDDDE